jgi:predicted amidophosphoribosyltransferase
VLGAAEGTVWAGLCIDAILYAASLWLIVRAWRGCRALCRRNQGQCEGCGYDRGSLRLCPECGSPADTAHRAGPHMLSA